MKFEKSARDWFKEYAEPRLKITTIKGYHDCETRTYQAIGHLKMSKITTRTIQKFIINLGENGVNKQTGKGLSPKSIKNYLSFISTIFNYAMKQGVVPINPCKGYHSRQLSQSSGTVIPWKKYSISWIYWPKRHQLSCVFSSLWPPIAASAGELFGLEWSDIDFDTSVISIQRSSLYTKEQGLITDTPKTKSSIRYLKMPSEIMALLKQYKAAQAEEQLKLGDQWVASGRLFVSWNGKPMNPNSARNWLLRFCKREGVRPVNVHSFRHLNASLLINSGTDIKTVSAALGHTQVSTTLTIYAHTFAAAQAKHRRRSRSLWFLSKG